MKKIEVVAAIILNEERFLCVQRGEGKLDYISFKYEFPGGKIEPGESREDALIREIREELSIEILIEKEYMTVIHQYPDFLITMHGLLCTCNDIEKLHLNEHINYKWLSKYELDSLDWAEADKPIVKRLMEDLEF
jgi:8-oxo-dGTP diphosphatase